MTVINGLNFCSVSYVRINNQNSMSSSLKLNTLQQDTVSFSASTFKFSRDLADVMDILGSVLEQPSLNDRNMLAIRELAERFPELVLEIAAKKKLAEKANKPYNGDFQAVRNFLNQCLPKNKQI